VIAVKKVLLVDLLVLAEVADKVGLVREILDGNATNAAC
jgi:hypothetical protein